MLSKYLKNKRLEAGLSQGNIAKALGYTSPQFVSNWERGIANPSRKALPKLCKLLKIDKDQFKQVYLDMELARVKAEVDKIFAKA